MIEGGTNSDENEEKISLFATAVNIFKGSIGTGILGLPFAVKNCGILVGTISLSLLGIVTVYCMNLIIICNRFLSRKYDVDHCDYGDVAEYALKPYGARAAFISRLLTDLFIMFTQIGFLCVFVVFMCATIEHQFHTDNILITVSVIFVALVCITSTTNIVIIGYFSTAASIIQCIALSVLFVYLASHFNAGENLKLIGDYRTLPLFFGTAMFAFEGIAVILPLEKATRRRDKFFLVMDVSMGCVCLMYITSGFLGYAAYGDDVKGSVTLNLPHNTLNLVIEIFFIVAIFLTYPIQFYVPMKIIERYLGLEKPCVKNIVITGLVKAFIVMFTCVAAVLIPRIENLLSLSGSFAASSISLIFPSFFHFMCFKDVKTMPKYLLIVDILIITVGVAGSIVGTYAASVELFMSNDTINLK